MNHRAVPILLIALLTVLAFTNRFVQDDAFISFRYAYNLVEHGQLDWDIAHPGTVEGYTNFLWVLLIALGMRFGIDPITTSWVFGLLFFVGSLTVSYRLASHVLGSERWALLVLLLLGTNFSFSAYATGGLETSLQTLLFVTGLWTTARLLEGTGSRADRILLSAVCVLAVLNRLDALVPFGVMYGFLLTDVLRSPSKGRQHATRLTELVLLPVMILGGFVVWKLGYYGEFLPNTYYAKLATGSDGNRVQAGITFVVRFLKFYRLELATLVVVVGCALQRDRGRVFWLILSCLISWLLYIVRVGGDFMEFRFVVPVIPLFFLLFVQGIATIRPRIIAVGIVVLVIASSFIHRNTFEGASSLNSIESLELQLYASDHRWVEMGGRLAEEFTEWEPPVVIATTAAGAIPYYSRLSAIDMLGLNDRETARHGHAMPQSKVGHRRFARLDYLLERNVNLLIGHPQLVKPDSVCTDIFDRNSLHWRMMVHRSDFPELPDAAPMVEIPLKDGARLLALYLTPHPGIEDLIRMEGWTVHEISHE